MKTGTNTRRSAVSVSLAVLILIALAGCGVIPGIGSAPAASDASSESGETVVTGANVETVFAVNVTPAVQGEINDYIEVNGDVQATATVDVFADTVGELSRLLVRIGQRVAAGDVIAEVDPSRPGANFTLSPVRAPIAGTITRLPAQVGSTVTQAAPIAQISRTSDLEIVTRVSERFISKIRVGLTALIRLDAFPEQQFAATVTALSPVVDPVTRTLEVTLRLNRADARVRAGMYAEVRIITERKEGIVKVPSDVMLRRFGETFVFVVGDDGIAERRNVNPGIEIDNKLEITEGLEPGELVVYQGQTLLEDGAQVRVINTINVLSEEDRIE